MLKELPPLFVPPIFQIGGANATTLNHANDYLAAIIQAPATGTITDIFISLGTVTSAQSLSVGIYTLDASTGAPSTLVGTAGTIASPSANVVVGTDSGCSASVTKGSFYAVKVAFTSTAGNLNVNSYLSSGAATGSGVFGFPLRAFSTDDAGTVTKSQYHTLVPFSLSYGGTFYYSFGIQPACKATNITLSSTSGASAAGNRFQVPAQMQATGAWISASFTNGGSTVIDLYADATAAGGTPLATVTVDEDYLYGAGVVILVMFDAAVTLEPSTWYRLVLRATAATGATMYQINSVAAAAHLKQQTGLDNCYYTSYASSAWTNTDTALAPIGLQITAIHDAGGVGPASLNLGI